MRGENVSARQLNRSAAALIVCAVLLSAALMFLPLLRFDTVVYSKRSPNTFEGDESHAAALQEARDATASFDSADLQFDEEFIVRTNSKGKTTSVLVLTVRETVKRTGWQTAFSGLTGGSVLLLSFVLSALGLGLFLLGMKGTSATPYERLTRGPIRLRAAGTALFFVSALLVPVSAMVLNVNLSRSAQLALNTGSDAYTGLFERINGFLFGNRVSTDEIASLLKASDYAFRWPMWLRLPLLLLCAAAGAFAVRGEGRRVMARTGLYLFVIALCVLILYPYYVMLITAFRDYGETTDMYFTHMFPTRWVFGNLADITRRGVMRYLANSIVMAGGATLIALACGIPAAYAMARMQFAGKKAYLGFVIMSQMFAPVVLLVGISRLMNTLRLNNTLVGLMLINGAFNQAFAIWLLRGTFVSISSEMEQAACIDGCNTFTALLRVLIPMAMPGIVTTLIFVFINAWNEYTIATVLISTSDLKPITVGITQFSSFNMIEWQYLFAAALLATLPVVILFMLIEKHLVGGLTSGGVKG